MKDLEINIDDLLSCFVNEQEDPYVFISVTEECVASWSETLGLPVRRCYVTDDVLQEHHQRTGFSKTDLLAAKLPDRGAIMAGDFGEILVYLYHAVCEHPTAIIGPKKWRLKQDRTKAAPGSDVVHFVVPSWPNASEEDRVLCSEVKTKSTPGGSTPITSAIEDCKKDRVSRLAKTLVWLKERALNEDLGTTTISHLERFIKATDNPPAQKHYYAVAVVGSSLVEAELLDAPKEASEDFKVVVISVPLLKELYENVFDAAIGSAGSNDGDML